ncbi:MAG: hypothetical protein EA412_01650 [Chitinophagaceae bacterium]|nr:MAG: hypothetical protein EA412_01650 [Chitinophagaceae bacterium]
MVNFLRKKATLLLFLSFFISTSVFSQILEPVKWSFSYEKTGENTYDLIFTANIDEGWYVYSQFVDDNGPIPTTFEFDESSAFKLIGNTKESGEIIEDGYDHFFDMDLKKIGKKGVFTQSIESTEKNFTVNGYLEFMTCDDERCLPPDMVDFEFNVKAASETSDISLSGAPSEQSSGLLEPVKWNYKIVEEDGDLFVVFEALIDEGWYVYSGNVPEGGPIPTTFEFEEDGEFSLIGDIEEWGEKTEEGLDQFFDMELTKYAVRAVFRQQIDAENKDIPVRGFLEFMTCDDTRCLPPDFIEFAINTDDDSPIQTDRYGLTAVQTPVEENRSMWGIFIAGFIGGLIALLTPCVFPMIPLTVSFFTKSSTTKRKGVANASLYAVFIIVIYVVLGYLVTVILGADALNRMATSAFFNMLFFAVFVIFAISFFGYFEISLPTSLVNKVDSASDVGGIVGNFFMAFTLVLVSFSCTGPIVGTLLVQAAVGGNVLGPVVGMAGFAVALALPFGLFAAFPGWLNSLPKSGGWLNTIKVSLGFLELALALKFLSNVDLVYNFGLIKRETFIAIWIIIFLAWAIYLLGKIKFPGDSPNVKISKTRWAFVILIFAFIAYLIPGFRGAPLSLLSGFPPPTFYSIFETENNCPHGIPCFHELEEGFDYAKKVNKPILLDFTGWACINCRKMEENVWIEPEILPVLKEKYILLSLYVDDRTMLPEDEQFVSDCTGRRVRTIGNKWSDFQACVYNMNSQPYYVLLNHDGNPLNDPRGYTPNKNEFLNFLNEGLDEFERLQALTSGELGKREN